MRTVNPRRHWESLQELFRDLYDFCVAPYRVLVVWA
jgi:hypothetical protein